jgi:hypothetical protein
VKKKRPTTRAERTDQPDLGSWDQRLIWEMVPGNRNSNTPDRSLDMLDRMTHFQVKHHNRLFPGALMQRLRKQKPEIHSDVFNRMISDGDIRAA